LSRTSCTHHLHQSRRAGEELDPQEIQGFAWATAGSGESAAAHSFGYPLSLYTYEPALTAELNELSISPRLPGTVTAPAGIVFKYAKGPLTVTKTFTFNESYVIDTQVSVTRNPARRYARWWRGPADWATRKKWRSTLPASLPGRSTASMIRRGANKTGSQQGVNGNATLEQPYDYAATIDLYFAAAFLPAVPSRATVVTLHNA
jgi:YidC/Oxa1 family membrane protein insertase